jgi:PIN domain nuclease of toxin-antitoxin system
VNVLLDTHVWIWSQELPERFGVRTTELLLDPASRVFVSTTSTLEIARLVALGRLRLTMDLGHWVSESLRHLDSETIEISHEIAIEAYRLPDPFQRDPADRLLVATARIHGLQLLTADEAILGFPGVRGLDCRA